MRRRRLRGLVSPACSLPAKEQVGPFRHSWVMCLSRRLGRGPSLPGQPCPCRSSLKEPGPESQPQEASGRWEGQRHRNKSDAYPQKPCFPLQGSASPPLFLNRSRSYPLLHGHLPHPSCWHVLDSHQSFQTTLPACVLSPTYCQHSRVIP